MILASLCTIPQRAESFQQVVRRILHEQTQPVDGLHVWLNGYAQIGPELPQDRRLIYHLEPANPGPWVRYRPADYLDADDIFITLDDDLCYPPDYIERGLDQLQQNPGCVICFGGILWDPLAAEFAYGRDRWQFEIEQGLSTTRSISLLKGQGGFFRGNDAKDLIHFSLPGLKTNDDMMVSFRLQQRGVAIRCAPRPADWVLALPEARAPHALYRRDASTRHETFRRLVYELGFDPTAGCLDEFLALENRILVLADTCPPLPGSETLEKELLRLAQEFAGVHLVAPVGVSQAGLVQQHVDIPYTIHTITAPDPGGRLNWLPPVRAWRNRQINRTKSLAFQQKIFKAFSQLNPTKVIDHKKVTT